MKRLGFVVLLFLSSLNCLGVWFCIASPWWCVSWKELVANCIETGWISSEGIPLLIFSFAAQICCLHPHEVQRWRSLSRSWLRNVAGGHVLTVSYCILLSVAATEQVGDRPCVAGCMWQACNCLCQWHCCLGHCCEGTVPFSMEPAVPMRLWLQALKLGEGDEATGETFAFRVWNATEKHWNKNMKAWYWYFEKYWYGTKAWCLVTVLEFVDAVTILCWIWLKSDSTRWKMEDSADNESGLKEKELNLVDSEPATRFAYLNPLSTGCVRDSPWSIRCTFGIVALFKTRVFEENWTGRRSIDFNTHLKGSPNENPMSGITNIVFPCFPIVQWHQHIEAVFVIAKPSGR